jgi:hypothetical protein
MESMKVSTGRPLVPSLAQECEQHTIRGRRICWIAKLKVSDDIRRVHNNDLIVGESGDLGRTARDLHAWQEPPRPACATEPSPTPFALRRERTEP